MAQRQYYYRDLKHPLTGVTIRVTGSNTLTLNSKVERQLKTWTKELGVATARQRTNAVQAELKAYRNLLIDSLDREDKIDWASLEDHESYGGREPELSDFYHSTHNLFGFLASAKAKDAAALEAGKQKLEQAAREYEQRKKEFENQQKEHNEVVARNKRNFENKEPKAVARYLELVLQRSPCPTSLNLGWGVQYGPNEELAVIEVELPHPDKIPQVIEYTFSPKAGALVNTVNDSLATKTMKTREFEEFYNTVLYQIALRAIHEVLNADYINAVRTVAFNGYVSGFDPKTGSPFHNCVLSLQAERFNFATIDLAHIDPKECFRYLKGVNAGSLVQLAPVKPLLVFDQKDKRIIHAEEIIGTVEDNQNLATMDWQAFEILVRDLFEKEFGSQGCRVEVTRQSRDEGVDAIAYDEDPIRGGKFVIQAKRYNNLVPVSAVRDLYGTVMNEGAVKGILVTTSYYGPEARDFVKDKPLTLIAGPELISLFNKHGFKVKIELRKKQAAASRLTY